MAILNRITLKNFFRKGSVPTETNFADLIDSSINIVEDGIGRSVEDGFRIAPMGYSKRLLSFYENAQKSKPDWFISLNDGNSKGLAFHESDSENRLVLKNGGNIGIGISNPTSKLEVKGCIGMDERKGTFLTGQVPGDAKWHNIIAELDGISAFEIMAQISGKKGSGRYAISHAIALATYGGYLSRWSIRKTAANYGGFLNQLQFRWTGSVNNYALQIRTRRHYGLNDQNAEPYPIFFNVTKLWSINE
ncbi:MAG: hypothetical protein KGQ86_00160 [Bacteroidetes bacterium]|jgi:hypothetical protein|nr:hypothetical protein [Bacteroidota bacterium]